MCCLPFLQFRNMDRKVGIPAMEQINGTENIRSSLGCGGCVLSGSVLKLIAVFTMLIDHSAFVLVSRTQWGTAVFTVLGKELSIHFMLRQIGRLAFPLFCFLLVEGFLHTHSRKRYAGTLACFALISEIPFDYMVAGRWLYLGKQNIYFTLLLGILLLYVLDCDGRNWKKGLCLTGIYVLARLLKTDYGFNGIVLMGLLYILREKKLLRPFFALPLLSGGLAAFAAFIPISMYNGKRGFIRGNVLKYVFYLFYPAHIMVLLVLKKLLLD